VFRCLKGTQEKVPWFVYGVIIVTALKVNILNSVSIFVFLFALEIVTGFK
jgi:hypothetical protein